MTMPGIGGLRYFTLNEFLDICQKEKLVSDLDLTWREKIMNDMIRNKHVWAQLIPFINSFDSKSFSKRLEGNNVDFYTNDKKLYDGLCSNFSDFVRLRFEPPKGKEQEMLEADKVIFAKKLPHDKYQYKAYLQPHKVSADDKLKLAAWMDKQIPSITFTDSIRNWLINTSENWDRRYIYIQDEKTLLMIKLRSPHLVGQIFKYEIIR